MKTRILETKFWKDAYVAGLTPEEKFLYLYFLLNERVNIIHCYEITDREVAFDTGIDRGIVETTKKKLEKDGKVAFRKDYVCLINAYKYESYRGPKNEDAKKKLILQLGDEIAKWYRGIYTPLIGTINHKSEIINHNTEIINIGKVEKIKKEIREKLGKTAREKSVKSREGRG
jgi:hypothetical protein